MTTETSPIPFHNGFAISRDGQQLFFCNGLGDPVLLQTFAGEGPTGVTAPEAYGGFGDGVHDDGPFVALAVATGMDVYLTPGKTYLVNGTTLVPQSNQRIFGGGRLKKTVYSTDIPLSGIQDAPRFIRIENVTNVSVLDIEFEYTGPTTPRVYGVTIENSSNTLIRGNAFLGNETPCFIWRLSTKTRFVGNSTFGGVFGIATGGDAAGNTNGVVSETEISQNFFSRALSEAIDINWDTQRCLISNNFCFDNNRTVNEEDIDIGGGVCKDIQVVNNVIDGAGRSIIAITAKLSTVNLLIRGNLIFNGKADATTGKGVRITGAGGAASKVIIAENYVSGFYKGVTFDNGVSDGEIVSNQFHSITTVGVELIAGSNSRILVQGNTINGGGTATGSGIHVADTTGFRIIGNNIQGFVADGITLFSSASGGLVSQNEVTTCDDGIACLAPNTVLSQNRCHLNGGAGINLQAQYLTCQGNHLYNNAQTIANQYGLLVTGGSDFSIISGNSVYDTQGTKTQNGILFIAASDRVIYTSNLAYNNKTTNESNAAALTNSVNANNIIA